MSLQLLVSHLLLTAIALSGLAVAQVERSQASTAQTTPSQRFSQSKVDAEKSRSYTLSNQDWKITIGNTQSWSGVNGTGNLTYRGCDVENRCINLTGGRVTCRDGICRISWQNRNYFYILEEPMDNPDLSTSPGSATVLTVYQGSKIILRTTGFKSVSNR